MAKGQNVGKLYFGIDGDDKELKKKLKDLKLESVAIADIFKSIKLDTGGGKLAKDTQKAQLAADKLLTSNEKLVKSIHNTARAEEQLSNEKKKGSVIEEQRTLAIARRIVEEERKGYITAKNLREEIRAQQQAEMHALRVESANKRKANAGTKGQQDFKKSIDESNKSLSKQGDTLSSLEKKIIGVFSAHQLSRFAKEIINIRGQFQGLELGFETMLGSAEKSRKMMADITDMALKTPYSVKEVADNTKQLIAMGIEADKAIDTMKALADVSSGLAVPMWRIAINYGQVQTLGRLQQREIRDFAMAGVPIVEELAKQLGKTKSEITEMVQAGKIGFPMVEKAFMSMAGEGGKFHNMTEKLNSTMLGQMNRLTDQIQLMFNAIGKSNEGVIYSAISGASTLVENYEAVGKTILGLVAIYGAYKAVLMVTNIALRVQSEMALQAALSTRTFAGVTNTLTASQKLAAVATTNWHRAIKALIATIKNNPLILIGAQVALMTADMYAMAKSTEEVVHAHSRLSSVIEDTEKSIISEIIELNNYVKKLHEVNESSQDFNKLRDEFIEKYSKYNSKLVNEISTVADVAAAYDQLEISIRKSSAARRLDSFKSEEQKGLEDKITDSLSSVYKKLRDRVGNNEESLNIYSEFYKAMLSNEPYEKLLEMEKKYKMSVGVILRSGYNDIRKYRDASEKIIEDFKNINQIVDVKPIDLFMPEPDTKPTNYGIEYDAAKKAWETAKKGLDAIKNDRKSFSKEQWESAKDLEESTRKVFEALGGETKRTPNRDFKDPIIAKLEKRIEIFKKAKVEFDKLSKTMDADSAFAKLNENPAFKGISKDELSADGFISSIDKMIAEVSKLKVSDERDKLLANLFTLKEDTISKLAKEAFDAIERELSKYKDKYNLYETLLGITGNEEQAQKLVFGNADEVVKSYRDKLKEAISKTEDKDFKKKLEDDLFSLEVNESSEFLKNIGKLLGKYQTIEDKIAKIKLDGVRERQKISDNEAKGELDSDLASKAINASINKQKELIAELENESLKLTPFYQKLFGDIGSYGNRMLDSLIDKTKEIIGEANKTGKNSSGLYEIKIDGESVSLTESDLARLIKQLGVLEGKVNSSNPFKRLAESIKEYNKSTKEVDGEIVDKDATDKAEDFSKLGESMMAAGDAVRGLSSDLAGMFDALGNEDMADAIGLIGELGDSLSEVAGGIMSGNYIQAASGIIKSLTSIFNFHDKKLDKAIKKSQLEVKKLQNSYNDLSRFISRQLGALTKRQAQEQIDNLKRQQAELRKQQEAEEDKKKKDRQAIEDYKNSIKEIGDQIKYFYEDLFNEQYGFDFGSISEQLSSALVEAFKNGEDAAGAFDNTVSDIINNLASKMITLQVIEPAMGELRDYLFGDSGVFNDGELSVSDAQGLVSQMTGLKDSIGQSKEIWDALNEAAKKAGVDLSGVSDKSTLSKGIKGITEDQANLLASYANAMRADGSITKEQIITLVKISQLNTNTLGNMLAELVAIRQNTFDTAGNTLRSADIAQQTYDLLRAATIKNGGTGWNLL